MREREKPLLSDCDDNLDIPWLDLVMAFGRPKKEKRLLDKRKTVSYRAFKGD